MSSRAATQPYTPPPHQREVDERFAAARKDAAAGKVSIFKPAPPRPKPSEDILDQRLAEELQAVRRRLELLGDALASDPLLVHRHGRSVQGLDLVNQILGHLAAVVETRDRDLAVEAISMGDLRARLQRKPIASIAFN